MTVFCSYLLTCGSDGDVRIYKDFDDSDPESVRAGDNVTVLVVKVRMWFLFIAVAVLQTTSCFIKCDKYIYFF